MGNAVGFAVLLLLVGLTGKLVHLGSSSVGAGVAIYLVLAALAWKAWHEKDVPKTPGGWLGMAVGFSLLGACSFLIDVAYGLTKDSSLSMWAIAQQAGSMFGFALTVTVFPSLIFISVAGAARSAFLSAQGDA